MTEAETHTRDHWWWRPGWREGRSCYTWHILVDDQPVLHAFADRMRPDLERVEVLDPIPVPWLHMTMQGVGFTDEVSQEDLAAISSAVAGQVAGCRQIDVTLGPVVANLEGVTLWAHRAEEVAAVRTAVRRGLAEVWGEDRVPEAADGFHPHVSLAYANTTGAPLAPIREMLARHAEVVDVTLTRLTLIDMNRDEGMYKWAPVRTIPLGG